MQPAFEQLATAEFNGDVILRDVADAKPEGRKLRHDQAVRTIAYSPKGDLLATASHDQFARLWRVSDRTMTGTAMRHDDPITRLVFTPNGAMLATQTEDGTVRLWDAATAQPLTVPWRHSGRLCDLFFENDGARLVAAVDHGAVYLHEVPLLPRSAPEWLPKLAEAVARQGVDESGELSRAKLPDLTALRARAESIPATEPYGRWQHWFFADRATRSISASSEKPMSAGIEELVSGLVAQDDLEEARRRCPLDPKLMERLAAEYRKRREPAFAAHADFLIALAAWNAGDAQNRIQAARKRLQSKIFDERGMLRDSEFPPRILDLTSVYNGRLDQSFHYPGSQWSFLELPQGLQKIEGIEFDIRGMVVTNGRAITGKAVPGPKRVNGIPVSQTARQLHFLHACSYGAAEGTRIGTYHLHYADGQIAELPIIYGEDLRDYSKSADQSRGTPKNAREIFPRSGEKSVTRLFLRTYENPRPEVEITTIDFESAMAAPAPFVVAITVE